MVKRSINLSKILEKKQSFFLFGPRGSGKTSLLLELLHPLQPIHIDLLRSNTYLHYLKNPGNLGDELRKSLKQNKSQTVVVFIDEVQKVPSLLDEVHSLIEEAKGKIFFALSGSSARKLKRQGANLLAGRAITKYLHPLNSRETEIDLLRALQFGSLPGIYLQESLEIERLETYVATYLKEEIQEESLVRQVDKFARFLEISAQLNGEPINFNKLSKQCGVSTKTAQEYFEILVDTLIVKRVDGWAHSKKRQLLQSPRFWYFDCGVVNALNGDLRSTLSQSSYRFGKLFETWVIQEIIRLNDDLNLGLRFNYWRDSQGHEVDLVISRSTAKPICAIEIKSATRPEANDTKNLKLFAHDYPRVPLWCFCRTERAYDNDGVEYFPWRDGLNQISQSQF